MLDDKEEFRSLIYTVTQIAKADQLEELTEFIK
jgi:hypothetical protein